MPAALLTPSPYAKDIYKATCPRCHAVLAYRMSDLQGESVACPHCHYAVPHASRNVMDVPTTQPLPDLKPYDEYIGAVNACAETYRDLDGKESVMEIVDGSEWMNSLPRYLSVLVYAKEYYSSVILQKAANEAFIAAVEARIADLEADD